MICLIGISISGLILSLIVLIPSLVNGPAHNTYLKKTVCQVNNITYINNLCQRDLNNDIFALIYQDVWNPCYIAQVNITPRNIPEINQCVWYYDTELSDINSLNSYYISYEYNCVVDTLKSKCYPDKNEIEITYSVLGIFISLIIIFSICLCRIRRQQKNV
jgi:hypothetical protein